MPGFEFAPGPAVSLCEFNTNKIFYRVESAVYYTGLTAVCWKFHGYNRIRLNLLFHFQACPGWRNIFQDAPLVLGLSGFRFPLNFDQVSTKFPVFTSIWYHDLSIGKIQPMFRITLRQNPKENPVSLIRNKECSLNKRTDKNFTNQIEFSELVNSSFI